MPVVSRYKTCISDPWGGVGEMKARTITASVPFCCLSSGFYVNVRVTCIVASTMGKLAYRWDTNMYSLIMATGRIGTLTHSQGILVITVATLWPHTYYICNIKTHTHTQTSRSRDTAKLSQQFTINVFCPEEYRP